MEGSFLSEVALPLAIFLIMISVGMSLTVADFRRLADEPKPVAVGLGCQLVLLPALGFGIAALLPLEPLFAVSVVLLAGSPGGTTSNLVSHVADLDRALSVTLTSISNVAVFLLLPFELRLAENLFGALDGEAGVPILETMLQVAALTILPVIIGMVVRAKREDFALRMQDAGKLASGILLGLVIVALLVQEWETAINDGPRFAAAFILLNALALFGGLGVARAFGLDLRRSVTIGVETGLQNATLAITVAVSVLDNDDLAIVPALYGLWMLITGFPFALGLMRGERVKATAEV